MPKLTLNNKPINTQRILLIIIVLVLLVSNIFWGLKYSDLQKELERTKSALGAQKLSENVLNFTNLFINKVLKEEEEISFEERLKLENAVRELNDKDIINQWEKFVNSETESEAQKEVKNLLELLILKIQIK